MKMDVVERPAVRNTEAEAVVLGALMCDNKAIDRVADRLAPEDFYEPGHAAVYSIILREANLGRPANPVTLAPYLADDEWMKALGGAGRYLAQLTANPLVLMGMSGCVDQVINMARRRRLIAALEDAADMARDMNQTNEDVIAAADAAVSSQESSDDGVVQISARDAFREMIDTAEDGVKGVSAPVLPSLNDQMGPIKPHHLAIVAGRPGMGKTALALSYALSAALAGHGVLFVSLEMSRTELMQRAVASLTFNGRFGVLYEKVRDNDLSQSERRMVMEAGRQFEQMPLHIVDAGSLTIGRLNMIARRYKRRMAAAGKSLDLVVVDYLQLVRPDYRTSGPTEAVSEVSRGLKSIAKTHNLGVMALAQLNRSVETRDDKRPKLSDLRDSGQIEQDADAVTFLYRDEYYLRMAGPGSNQTAWEQALEACRGILELIVAKRRNGRTGSVEVAFDGGYMAVSG